MIIKWFDATLVVPVAHSLLVELQDSCSLLFEDLDHHDLFSSAAHLLLSLQWPPYRHLISQWLNMCPDQSRGHILALVVISKYYTIPILKYRFNPELLLIYLFHSFLFLLFTLAKVFTIFPKFSSPSWTKVSEISIINTLQNIDEVEQKGC